MSKCFAKTLAISKWRRNVKIWSRSSLRDSRTTKNARRHVVITRSIEMAGLAQKLTIEVLGTGLLCFTVAMSAGRTPMAPIAIGSTLMTAIYFGGHVSGAQYNPAVALAVFLRGKMTPVELVTYWAAQIAGGFGGGALAKALEETPAGTNGYPAVNAAIVSNEGRGNALMAEIIVTWALCHVVLHCATTKQQADNSYYGLAIGFTVLSGAVSVGGVSGGAFNPAVGI